MNNAAVHKTTAHVLMPAADLLGIPYLIPYAVTALINATEAHRTTRAANKVLPAVPLAESAAQLAHGISYAACGAGALQSTAGWSSLEEQVAAFEWAVKNGTWAPMTVTNALVVVGATRRASFSL